MVLAYTSFGYVDPRTGLQVAFPYTDRYQDWTIAIEWFSKAKQDFSYYGTGTIGTFYVDKIKTMIATNDQILIDAARQLSVSDPFAVFGAMEPTIIELSPEAAATITGSELVSIEQALQGAVIEETPIITRTETNELLVNGMMLQIDEQIITTHDIPEEFIDMQAYSPEADRQVSSQQETGQQQFPTVGLGIAGILIIVMLFLFLRRRKK